MNPKKPYVHVQLDAGSATVDILATADNGWFDDVPQSGSETIRAVRENINLNEFLINPEGNLMLIEGPVRLFIYEWLDPAQFEEMS